jgi:predicted permease
MVLNSLFPVFSLVALGVILKRCGLTNDQFLSTSDRLVYYIFFPALLFWKIGAAEAGTDMPWAFILAAFTALGVIYLLSAAAIFIFKISAFQAGTFSQSCYRFNTYIGMAVVLNATGAEGVRAFSVLVGLIIPVINVLAVSTLIWYADNQLNLKRRLLLMGRSLISNPLILACLAGIVYARISGRFPPFIDNTLALFSMVTLPLALFSIGGSLQFKSLAGYLPVSLLGSCYKMVLLPLIGLSCLKLWQVEPVLTQIGMLFFALPTSPAIYVLSSQLNSDTRLAAATIVLSTLLGFFSLSIVLVFFF